MLLRGVSKNPPRSAGQPSSGPASPLSSHLFCLVALLATLSEFLGAVSAPDFGTSEPLSVQVPQMVVSCTAPMRKKRVVGFSLFRSLNL